MYCYFVLKANGNIIVRLQEDKEFVYETLRRVIDGFIEIVRPVPFCQASGDSSLRIVVNDEGKLRGLPVNDLASDMYSEYGFIAGDVILCKEIWTEEGPDVGAFSKKEAQRVAHAIRDFGYEGEFTVLEVIR